MQLDYIPNINEYKDNIVRLYDFDMSQAIALSAAIRLNVVIDKKALNLNSLSFIQPRNCNLLLKLAYEDLGIVTTNNINFVCDLTLAGYKNMLLLMEPFCKKNTKGHQYLYEVDSQIDFLFSPAGSW